MKGGIWSLATMVVTLVIRQVGKSVLKTSKGKKRHQKARHNEKEELWVGWMVPAPSSHGVLILMIELLLTGLQGRGGIGAL